VGTIFVDDAVKARLDRLKVVRSMSYSEFIEVVVDWIVSEAGSEDAARRLLLERLVGRE
jgi:hypothetical protein